MNEELTTAELVQAADAEEAKEMEIPTPEDVRDTALTAEAAPAQEPVDPGQLVSAVDGVDTERSRLKAIIEAVIYITDEPLSPQQIAGALGRPIADITSILEELTTDYGGADRGLSIREVAGGYKLGTKPEHHEEIRAFVKNLKPPLKLSLAALETLAVIAYKQPITAPEIMEIRGVQGAGVLKTLLDRKLVATAGRKNVIGKPILYKTTKEFLVQFGLKDLSELPTLKEFEELGRLALTDAEADPFAGLPEPAAVEAEPALVQATGPIETSDPDPKAEPPPVQEPEPEQPPVQEPPAEPDSPEPPEKADSTQSNG